MSPVEIHGNWDVIHASWSIGRIILRDIVWAIGIGLVLKVRVVIIAHITRRAIISLGSSSLIIALETSKRSSSES